MFQAISAAIYALFKALIPFTWERLNDTTKGIDAPPVPFNIRKLWHMRLRKQQSRFRS